MYSIIIVAYHPFVIQGLIRAIGEKYPDTSVKGFSTSAKGLPTLLEKHMPDAAIVDVAVTWNSNVDIQEVVNRIHPDVEIQFFHVHPLDQKVRDYLDAQFQKKRNRINSPFIDMKNLVFLPVIESRNL